MARRVAVKDERLAQEHAPLFTLLHRAANPAPPAHSPDPTAPILKVALLSTACMHQQLASMMFCMLLLWCGIAS